MKKLMLLTLLTTLYAPVYAASETYVIDNTHTYPRFSYSHFGFSTQLSRFDKTSGSISIDREAKTATVNVTIATNSVDTGYPLFNDHIQGADFFDTAKYPTATFNSTKATFDGDKLSTIEGELTLKGITKPVTLTVTSFQCMPHPMLKKDACGANATGTVKRSDFNMSKYTPHVGDEITLNISVEAVKE